MLKNTAHFVHSLHDQHVRNTSSMPPTPPVQRCLKYKVEQVPTKYINMQPCAFINSVTYS